MAEQQWRFLQAPIGLLFVCATVLFAQGQAMAGDGPVARRAGPKSPKTRPATRKTLPSLPKGCVLKSLTFPNGNLHTYVVFVPPRYILDRNYRWPVVICLHGSGECGIDGLKPMGVGLPREIDKDPSKFPFIAVFPQARTLWYRGEDAAAVRAILGAVQKEYPTDPDRVYLTGFSMGGFATWELAAAHPDLFAAIVPICGVGPPELMSNIVHLPVWAFHGAKDKNVPVSGSQAAIAELRRLGADPKYTEYPKVAHFSWVRAYATKKLWTWLLEQRRKPAPRVIDYRFAGGATRIWWLGVQAEEGLKKPAHIRAEISDKGRITVQSEGVAGWAIKSQTFPLKIGDQVEATWNGELVHKGAFTGGIAARQQQSATRPAPGG